jgi:hypothetical protein
MGICAVAYHESVAMERLEKYFDGESGSVSDATSTKCDRCETVFAVVLPARNHPDNARYLLDITRLISEDCAKGLHQDEYVLGSMQ